jgi:predicted RNase H-like HicB family nuclease
LRRPKAPEFELAKYPVIGDPPFAMSSKPLHLQLTATYEPAAEGGYTATFEELPDVFSEGETLAEAKANLMDALELVLDYHREQARKMPRHESSTTACLYVEAAWSGSSRIDT